MILSHLPCSDPECISKKFEALGVLENSIMIRCSICGGLQLFKIIRDSKRETPQILESETLKESGQGGQVDLTPIQKSLMDKATN